MKLGKMDKTGISIVRPAGVLQNHHVNPLEVSDNLI